MKETKNEREKNPKYYKVISCCESGCDETQNLLFHHYNETFMCAHHVNLLLDQVAREDEDNQEHDDYRDMSYGQLLQERNS